MLRVYDRYVSSAAELPDVHVIVKLLGCLSIVSSTQCLYYGLNNGLRGRVHQVTKSEVE